VGAWPIPTPLAFVSDRHKESSKLLEYIQNIL